MIGDWLPRSQVEDVVRAVGGGDVGEGGGGGGGDGDGDGRVSEQHHQRRRRILRVEHRDSDRGGYDNDFADGSHGGATQGDCDEEEVNVVAVMELTKSSKSPTVHIFITYLLYYL